MSCNFIPPYEHIRIARIFVAACDNNSYVEFILEDDTIFQFKVKEEFLAKKPFTSEYCINMHEDTEWSYTDGGAETLEEKKEVDDLISWSNPNAIFNWRTQEVLWQLIVD